MLLNRHCLELAKLATTEESRYSLSAILITPKEVQVTDGHQATIVTVPDQKLAKEFPTIEGMKHTKKNAPPVLVRREDALDLVKKIPKSQTIPILENILMGETKDDKIPFAVTDLDREQVIRVKKVPGTYPNLMQVMPDHRNAKAVICMNPGLLIDVIGQMKTFLGNGPKSYIALRIFDEESPIRLDAYNDQTGQYMTSAIMPMQKCGVEVCTRDLHPQEEPKPAEAEAVPTVEAEAAPEQSEPETVPAAEPEAAPAEEPQVAATETETEPSEEPPSVLDVVSAEEFQEWDARR